VYLEKIKNQLNQEGFSLVEVILAAVVIAIITTILAPYLLPR
jgi:prepilin-type N-terminal cleavage/methylation domain-containing protein